MNLLLENSIIEILTNSNIVEPQQILISEILNTGKYMPINKWYLENGMLLFILLHIKYNIILIHYCITMIANCININ